MHKYSAHIHTYNNTTKCCTDSYKNQKITFIFVVELGGHEVKVLILYAGGSGFRSLPRSQSLGFFNLHTIFPAQNCWYAPSLIKCINKLYIIIFFRSINAWLFLKKPWSLHVNKCLWWLVVMYIVYSDPILRWEFILLVTVYSEFVFET